MCVKYYVSKFVYTKSVVYVIRSHIMTSYSVVTSLQVLIKMLFIVI